MSKQELVEKWYGLKVDESKLRNAKGICKCINDFVKEQCGLEVLVNGGTLLIHDSSPGSYPYGDRFQISIFGEQKNVQELILALDNVLTDSAVQKESDLIPQPN